MTTVATTRMGSEALTAFFETRLFAYELLRQAFRQEPERGGVLSLAHSGSIRSFPFVEENKQIAQGVALVDAYLNEPAHSSAAAFDELHWDFTRMFIGPDKLDAPPWESAYRTDERLLFQAETLAVRQAYRKYGLQSPDFPAEPDDHIGLELDFMHQTTQMAARQHENRDSLRLVTLLQDQLDFLQQHLLTWVPQFAADVIRSATTDFYRGMARVLIGFLQVDRSVLQELLQDRPET